jgi:hypothetical protein
MYVRLFVKYREKQISSSGYTLLVSCSRGSCGSELSILIVYPYISTKYEFVEENTVSIKSKY